MNMNNNINNNLNNVNNNNNNVNVNMNNNINNNLNNANSNNTNYNNSKQQYIHDDPYEYCDVPSYSDTLSRISIINISSSNNLYTDLSFNSNFFGVDSFTEEIINEKQNELENEKEKNLHQNNIDKNDYHISYHPKYNIDINYPSLAEQKKNIRNHKRIRSCSPTRHDYFSPDKIEYHPRSFDIISYDDSSNFYPIIKNNYNNNDHNMNNNNNNNNKNSNIS
ncbi:hypothetical protein BCR32DRAFT_268442, partial [Anaeromyces robustus]